MTYDMFGGTLNLTQLPTVLNPNQIFGLPDYLRDLLCQLSELLIEK